MPGDGIPLNAPLASNPTNTYVEPPIHLYANVANAGKYAKFDQVDYHKVFKAVAGVLTVQADLYLNVQTNPVAVIAGAVPSELTPIPVEGKVFISDEILTVTDAVSVTPTGAAGANYAEMFVDSTEPGGVNSAPVPVTGVANGQLEILPNGQLVILSAAELANKLIGQTAATSVKVKVRYYHKFSRQ